MKNNFEMVVNDIFYLSHNRMAFSGKFVNKNSIHKLPIEVIILINNNLFSKIKLTALPLGIGVNARKDIDSIEASEQIDLKFINWGTDIVMLKEIK